MKFALQFGGLCVLGIFAAGSFAAPRAAAQDPILTPIIVDTAVPIVVAAVKPKPKNTGLAKFEGYVMHANVAQVTVRGKSNEMAVQTFALNQAAATKMQAIIEKGGYQYGDKITVFYNPQTLQAASFRGKPSRPL